MSLVGGVCPFCLFPTVCRHFQVQSPCSARHKDEVRSVVCREGRCLTLPSGLLSLCFRLLLLPAVQGTHQRHQSCDPAPDVRGRAQVPHPAPPHLHHARRGPGPGVRYVPVYYRLLFIVNIFFIYLLSLSCIIYLTGCLNQSLIFRF